MTTRNVQVTPLGRSREGVQLLDKMSFSVAVTEDGSKPVIEARITLGSLEMLTEPEKRIEEYFSTGPLPKTGTVIDIAV
jgi:hypothetical protein